jgi:hypothetical protein
MQIYKKEKLMVFSSSAATLTPFIFLGTSSICAIGCEIPEMYGNIQAPTYLLWAAP